MTTVRVISLILAGIGTSILGTPVSAETYPNQVVRIVVPFSAGSISDGLARILAEKLADEWKQQVIVENRPGLPGTTGVAKSAPDGYTLMLTSNGHTIAGAINKSIQFDPVKDFAGVSRAAAVPLVAIVPPDLPAKTLNDFITLAKERPGQLNFSSAGVASTSYLSAEIFKQDAKINILHIPYKGAPEATTAVIRNDAQMYFAPIPATQELSATGKVRAIAINTAARVPQLPDVPTIAETLPNCSRRARSRHRPRRLSSMRSTRPTPSATARSSRTPALRHNKRAFQVSWHRLLRRPGAGAGRRALSRGWSTRRPHSIALGLVGSDPRPPQSVLAGSAP